MADRRRFPAILLLGMPGTGKGTQGHLLGTMYGMLHVSTGEILRSLDPSSELGESVFRRIDQGGFVSDEEVLQLWGNWLETQIDSGRFRPDRHILVMDGIPRTVPQCHMLEPHVRVIAVLHLHPQDDTAMVERLLNRAITAGRKDDGSESIIRRRFEIYREVTAPVVDFYPSKIVHTIDPLGTVMEVQKRVLEVIVPLVRAECEDVLDCDHRGNSSCPQ